MDSENWIRIQIGYFLGFSNIQEKLENIFIKIYSLMLWCQNYASDWKCDNCPERVNAITMTTLIATCQEEINEFNDTKIELVVEKMNNWSNVLHKNHFLIGILRKRLFDLYRLYPAPKTEVELRPFLQVRMHKSWYFSLFLSCSKLHRN